MGEENYQQRLEVVKSLTEIFRFERTVHLITTTLSLLLLLFVAGTMIHQGKAGITELGAMFGSSGMVSYSASQLLRMWDKALLMVIQK